MNLTYTVTAIFIMALVTYIPRVLPITLFRRQISSHYIRTFLDYTPYAVLGALTFPDIFSSTGNIVPACAGTAAALLLAYFERGLVVVAVGAILAVYLVQLLVL